MKNTLQAFVLMTVLISSGYAQDTIHVYTGWNIIGSLGSGVVSEILVSCPPGIITSALYEYVPGAGYQSADTLTKGTGYWCKASQDGVIIFGGSTCSDIGGEPCPGTPMVSYGGVDYPTVQIGTRCWLAKNLNVGTMVTGVTEQTDNSTLEKYCYGNNEANCTTYGGLYQWNEAMQYVTTPGTRGICPPGWHIPTFVEIQTLPSYVGGDGNALKAVGQGTGSGAGTNTTGFSALLAGNRYFGDGSFISLGYYANLWSSTESDVTYAASLSLYYLNSSISLVNGYRTDGIGVRCLED